MAKTYRRENTNSKKKQLKSYGYTEKIKKGHSFNLFIDEDVEKYAETEFWSQADMYDDRF